MLYFNKQEDEMKKVQFLIAGLFAALFFLPSALQADLKADNQKKLAGSWKAEALGNELPKFGFKLPAEITFTADGSFVWKYTSDDKMLTSQGKFFLFDDKKAPFKIDLIQEKLDNIKEDAKMVGIFSFNKAGKLQLIFYNEKFLDRPTKMTNAEAQIYKKK
jgi:uncharacterized protein (TIGR03067 family)